VDYYNSNVQKFLKIDRNKYPVRYGSAQAAQGHSSQK